MDRAEGTRRNSMQNAELEGLAHGMRQMGQYKKRNGNVSFHDREVFSAKYHIKIFEREL
jgi:hypothetical protein